MRLHVIGLPSAGKTTLGETLSMLLTVPHYDLDGLAFVDEQWTMRPVPERDAMLARILEEPSFVTEGGFRVDGTSVCGSRPHPLARSSLAGPHLASRAATWMPPMAAR